jgi:KipI family sensor histidine kinase inhibitor
VIIAPAGDQAFTVAFGAGVDPATSARVLAAAERLAAVRPAGVTDVVPGYDTLLVAYDPLEIDPDDVRAWMAAGIESEAAPSEGRPMEIPVCYDPALAPDLEGLAAEKGLSVEALAARHAAPTYRCYLLGFRPGFPFLGGLDEGLAAPRLPSPRLRVPAGSVGIGGRQTGIYPVDSPGGWRLVGRTPLRLFDPTRAEPFLIRAGDRVRFVPIDRGTYDRMSV